MNRIFKYNANSNYSTKDQKDGYNSNNFSLLDVYLDEKKSSVKIQLPNIFKDHHIAAQPTPIIVGSMNGHYPLPFGKTFIIVMVNTSLN